MSSATTITAATARKFRVLWYEAAEARHLFDASTGLRRRLPGQKAKRKSVFEVEARTLDHARRLAREHVARRGARLLSVNFTQRPDELIVYTREQP